MAAPITKAENIGVLICEAMGIPVHFTTRIILDLQMHSVAQVYVQMHGSSKLLDIDWEAALKGAEVIIVGEQENLTTRE